MRKENRVRRGWLQAALVAAAIAVPATAQRAPLFKSEILPILEKNCVGCHGPQNKMASLDLSSFAAMMQGSSSGPVIAPGKPERSLMWKLIESEQMPQGGKLTAADKQSIKAYIAEGRFAVTTESEADVQKREAAKITAKDREWWSFQKPVKPAVPTVKTTDQARTEIDKFVLAQLEKRGWKMEPQADRVTLIRRAYFDLTGLPPTMAEVNAFVADKSANAYEKVIDSLLASPHY